MRRRVWVHQALVCVLTLGIFCSQAVTGTAAAASMTPFGPQRFAHAHATYAITTKSTYYRQIWQKAIRAWNATGVFQFKLGHAQSAQIDLSTDTAKQAAAMGDDVGMTNYWARHNEFIAEVCSLNPSLMKEYDYSRSDATHVAEHELGHAMGLNHNPSKHSVMYYRNRSEGIQKVDIAGVKQRYTTPAGETS